MENVKKGNLNYDQSGRAYPDKPHIKNNWDCIWEHNDKHYKLVGDDEHKEWEEVTPEEMDIEFNNTKLNYIANTLKEAANRMEYTGDISDLGNEIGVTVGHAYKNMTEENINDFIFGFRHGVSLTNGTH
jgi:2-keto-4-pentenoate hydratase/2-oxohepta-3-ene-1,7-dioic acid hydratase in catechol pathway